MTVTSTFLFKLGAGAAVLGGLLRMATALIPYTPDSAGLEAMYALTDILLLFATLAVYLRYADHLGLTGLVAGLLVAIGFASIVGPDPVLFGIDFYQLGAGIIIFAIALFSVQLLKAGILRLCASLWLIAFAFALGLIALQLPALIIASGIAFGAGYVAAGLHLIRAGDAV